MGDDFADEIYVVINDSREPAPGLTVAHKDGKWVMLRNDVGDVTTPELVHDYKDAGIIVGQAGESRAVLVSKYMEDLKANYGLEDGFNEHGPGRVPDYLIDEVKK